MNYTSRSTIYKCHLIKTKLITKDLRFIDYYFISIVVFLTPIFVTVSAKNIVSATNKRM